ncbi:hypothetical protein GCM10022225_63530 [Plantactinospora mayteni]
MAYEPEPLPPNIPPPLNMSTIAPIIAIMGRTISSCVHCRAGGAGISGGASSNSSPEGISGAGRRDGLRTTTVAMTATSLRIPPAGIVAAVGDAWAGMAGRCRLVRRSTRRP